MTRPPRKPKKTKGAAPREENAPSNNAKTKVLKCGNHHITVLRRKLRAAGLLPGSAKTETQLEALLKILLHLGEVGLNTPEGTGIAFARLATRVFDLEMQGWRIDTVRENVVTADGLLHRGIARYILRGPRADTPDPQCKLDLGE
jgi:hypothetical protein